MLPLSNVWFVDQAAAAAGNGSVGTPYQTLAAAVAAHPTGGTFVLTPYDYSAEVIPPLANGDWSFWGLQLGSWPEGFAGGAAPSPASLTVLPDLEIGAGGSANQVSLRSVALQNLGVQQSCSLVMQDVVVAALDCSTGPAGGTLLRADRCYFNGSGAGGTGLGDSQFNDCGFFGSQTLSTGGTNLQITRCFGETSIEFLAGAGVVNLDPWTDGALAVPVLTNGSKNLVGIVAPRTFEFLLTAATLSAGATDVTTVGTVTGAPFAANATILVQAALQFSAHVVAGYFEVLAQLQHSVDGGGSWSNIGNARRVSAVVNNNPTWFQISLPGVSLAASSTNDVQLRLQITNDAGSASAITNIDAAVTAITGQLP